MVIHPFGELRKAEEAVFKAAEKYAAFIGLPILNLSVKRTT